MLRGCALLCALQYGWRQPEPTDAKPIFYFSFFFLSRYCCCSHTHVGGLSGVQLQQLPPFDIPIYATHMLLSSSSVRHKTRAHFPKSLSLSAFINISSGINAINIYFAMNNWIQFPVITVAISFAKHSIVVSFFLAKLLLLSVKRLTEMLIFIKCLFVHHFGIMLCVCVA